MALHRSLARRAGAPTLSDALLLGQQVHGREQAAIHLAGSMWVNHISDDPELD